MPWSVIEDVLIVLGAFAGVVLLFWLRGRANQFRLARQAETHQQLLAKFQSGQELADFIETPGGREFMRQFEPNPHRMILGILSAGIVGTAVGLGLLFLMTQEDGFLYPGVVTTMIGVGLILAAVISRRLSQEWKPDG